MFSFVWKKPFFSIRLSARNPTLYLFDLFALLFVAATWAGLDSLSQINHSLPVAESSTHAFAMIAIWGVYGVRISAWIAILRRNRMPQVAEWLVSLVAFTLMVLCIVFSGALVKGYAAARGYHFCYAYYDRDHLLTFAKPQARCPPTPNTHGL